MTGNTKTVPDYQLERFALGELPPDRQAELERRVADEPKLRARLDALSRSNEEILDTYPSKEMARRIDGRVRIARAEDERRRSRDVRMGLFVGAPVFAAAAVLMLTVTASDPDTVTLPTGGPGEITRIKGNSQLVIHAERDGAQLSLTQGSTAQAGDLLQLSYRAGTATYGIILSIDGRGAITVHLGSNAEAAQLQSKGLNSLGHAYELDDAPDFERFFFVSHRAPFDVESVIRAATALSADPKRARTEQLRIEFEQTTLLLEKPEAQP